jgi:hypothetical protein
MNGITVAPAKVAAVLLADGWHLVVRGSFSVGALGFCDGPDPDRPGFCFEEADHGSPYRPATLTGPLTSILAVRQAGSPARHPGELARPAARRWARSTPDAVV